MSLIVPIGLGGFVGAIGSKFFVELVSNRVLEIIFFLFLLYAFYRVIAKKEPTHDEVKEFYSASYIYSLFNWSNDWIFCNIIGVGGFLAISSLFYWIFSLRYKKSNSDWTIFCIFSSLSGVISFTIAGTLEYKDALIIGTSSLLRLF